MPTPVWVGLDSEKHARFPHDWFVDLVARMGHAGAWFEPPEVYDLVVDWRQAERPIRLSATPVR